MGGDLKRAHDDGEASASGSSSKLARTAGGGDVAASKAKKDAAAGAPPKGQDADGNAYWELSKLRRIGISHFRNSTLVNIREYYDSAGQMRPGKKGISLSIEQYKALVRAIPAINAELRSDGVAMDDDDDDEAGEGGAAVAGSSAGATADKGAKKAKKDKKAPKKANIEATSDEDEGED